MVLPLPVVLASGSPRRRELLGTLVTTFTVAVPDVDEAAFTVSDPWGTAKQLAVEKARAVASLWPHALVIGGDTVVAFPSGSEFIQLGKPSSKAAACAMLRALSGQRHAVITGLALVGPGIEFSETDTSWVTFRELSDDEIVAYVDTPEPHDKAGAYAIQGGASAFVTSLEGSLTNVIGLPIELLERMLRGIGGI